MVPENVHQKLRFARNRLCDLQTLIAQSQLAEWSYGPLTLIDVELAELGDRRRGLNDDRVF
jgi:hypothetical protein